MFYKTYKLGELLEFAKYFSAYSEKITDTSIVLDYLKTSFGLSKTKYIDLLKEVIEMRVLSVDRELDIILTCGSCGKHTEMVLDLVDDVVYEDNGNNCITLLNDKDYLEASLLDEHKFLNKVDKVYAKKLIKCSHCKAENVSYTDFIQKLLYIDTESIMDIRIGRQRDIQVLKTFLWSYNDIDELLNLMFNPLNVKYGLSYRDFKSMTPLEYDEFYKTSATYEEEERREIEQQKMLHDQSQGGDLLL